MKIINIGSMLSLTPKPRANLFTSFVIMIGSLIVAGVVIWFALQPNHFNTLGDPYYHVGRLGIQRNPIVWWSTISTAVLAIGIALVERRRTQ